MQRETYPATGYIPLPVHRPFILRTEILLIGLGILFIIVGYYFYSVGVITVEDLVEQTGGRLFGVPVFLLIIVGAIMLFALILYGTPGTILNLILLIVGVFVALMVIQAVTGFLGQFKIF